MVKKYTWTIRFIYLTPLLLIFAVFLMGGGHGFYWPAIVLFPFGLVSICFFNRIEFPFVLLALLQYPLYGVFMDRLSNRTAAILTIATVHLILAVIIFLTKGSAWD